MNDIYVVLLIAGLLGLQYFFSTRENKFLGLIVPGLFTVTMIGMYIIGRIEHLLFIVLLLPVVLLFFYEQWKRGRESVQVKREKELRKMRSHDLH
ncbi:hypothetical protein [Salimicrobium halophilum]|uniref:YlaH-like protein n=1 Tax=Salimicrobium halophilum TaxID=86666 RepID=A0A1G8R6T8_9BACI|nr:hypothetical protein [Salimicrobium halophilum]SDJ12694.1 hypothetical protein SAMN04490247_0865 [Salimicrobium halophilum]